MATYKLIQDVEAEDKILGPLTLRQFIFALITAFLGYIDFILIAKQIYFLLIFFIPLTLLGIFFAFPFGRDQPTEIWALAKLRFLFKPRKRLWDQSGIKELVTITAPKKIQKIYSDGLSQTEVKSRLKALADTIDSRGWAIKNVNINSYAPSPEVDASTERLLDINSIPDTVPENPVGLEQDMLDTQNNPLAQQFDSMIQESTTKYKQRLIEQLNSGPSQTTQGVRSSTSNWFFMNSAGQSASPQTQSTTTIDSSAPDDLINPGQLKQNKTFNNLRTLKPLDASQLSTALSNEVIDKNAVTSTPNTDILALANNNDLNVSTIARQAKKVTSKSSGKEEVIISLH
ncbi:MAG: PrgI family protein [Candidatus Saccharimonadales bacterium]